MDTKTKVITSLEFFPHGFDGMVINMSTLGNHTMLQLFTNIPIPLQINNKFQNFRAEQLVQSTFPQDVSFSVYFTFHPTSLVSLVPDEVQEIFPFRES